MLMKLKKAFFVPLVIFGASACLFAQSDISQLVFPKRLYVGDTAELRYTFRSSIDFFNGDSASDELVLPVAAFPFQIDNREFSIEKASLQRNGDFYTVILTFIPWRTGIVDIPPFDLLSVLYGSAAVPVEINPQPFEVASVLPDGDDTQLRSSVPPLLIPGTMYVVYAVIFLCIVLLILIVKAAVSYSDVAAAVRAYMTLKNYAKNARRTLKSLRRLEKKGAQFSDEEFCAVFQTIMRGYLSVRFGSSFNACTSSLISASLEESTGGFMSDAKMAQAELLEGLFRRADYIRFAAGSADSRRLPAEQYSAAFRQNERSEFTKKARTVIQTFESPEPKVTVTGDVIKTLP